MGTAKKLAYMLNCFRMHVVYSDDEQMLRLHHRYQCCWINLIPVFGFFLRIMDHQRLSLPRLLGRRRVGNSQEKKHGYEGRVIRLIGRQGNAFVNSVRNFTRNGLSLKQPRPRMIMFVVCPFLTHIPLSFIWPH